ncbi:MAG: Y-family DNA polymerase [Hyphomicrobium sp.]|jgi:DNA polymerase V|uniref:Y-family DNA polymerase n=1 Tax=Hyphomicrobium sp. TaxID=82 RepID=UPI0025BB874E|nr:Y-family DNA polymerase [Hyphomicrobium sp.]MBX9862401.1 Y-family DNA polymerase [Hyphomicrobium sp.]
MMVGLVDCNNFYVSCERLFQPQLRGRPVVVLSNNDGCAVARSEEAKQLGVKMGAPWHLHRAAWKQAGVTVRSSNYALYGDLSNRVMSILRMLTPGIEVYSIDEAFIDFGGMGGREEQVARELRATILQWTGIPVSIGIVPTKTLAKVANRSAKKVPVSGGVRVLLTDEVQQQVLSKLEVEDIWGVATRLGRRLRALGIATAADMRNAAPEALRKEGGVVLERIGRELRGERCLQLDDATRSAKSIMASRSFGRPVTERSELEQAVASFVSRAAEKLRRQHLTAGTVTTFIHTSPFRPTDRQYGASALVRLCVASSNTPKLIQAALQALREIYRPGFRYVKAGILLDAFEPAGEEQTHLWAGGDSENERGLMATMDRVNRIWGRGTLNMAACGVRNGWSMRAEHLSPRYTTRWQDLLHVA